MKLAIRFIFKSSYKVAIGASVQLPIDVPRLIAGVCRVYDLQTLQNFHNV